MRSKDWLIVTFLGLVATFGINPYTYGLYNHFVSIPFFNEVLNPSLYPGDHLVAELEYFYTWFLKVLAQLSSLTGLPSDQLFFTVYIFTAIATVAAFYKLALTISGRSVIALVATILFLFGFKTLGGVGTFESLLMERSLVLPLELFALERLFRKKFITAFALAGLAFPIHPLSSIYVGGIIGFATLCSAVSDKPSYFKSLIAGAIAFILLASPSLYLKFIVDAPYLPGGTPDAGWLEILSLRSAHHVFPLTWSLTEWITTGLFLIGFHLSFQALSKQSGHRQMQFGVWAVLLMCSVGFICSELIPVGLPIQFQFFRSFRFLVYLGIIYLARIMVKGATQEHSVMHTLLIMGLMIPLWFAMDTIKFIAFLLVVATVFPAWRILQNKLEAAQKMISGSLFILLILFTSATLYLQGFKFENGQDPDWLEAQQWAKENTEESTAFIVPPNRWGFRLESQRTIYGDWNDGTQNFFNAEFGSAWLQRMSTIGYAGDPDALGENYRKLPIAAFDKAASELSENPIVYAVLFADQKWSQSEVLWENSNYKIVKIK
jgi:hypothetical protein